MGKENLNVSSAGKTQNEKFSYRVDRGHLTIAKKKDNLPNLAKKEISRNAILEETKSKPNKI